MFQYTSEFLEINQWMLLPKMLQNLLKLINSKLLFTGTALLRQELVSFLSVKAVAGSLRLFG